MKKINLGDLEFERYEARPEGYGAGIASFGKSIGAAMLGATFYDLPPGQSVGPYHYEYGNEELALILQGRPTLRHPGGEDPVEPMDVICFPVGPEGAHNFTNETDETVRVLLFSTMVDPALAVYPDSDKIGVFPGDEHNRDHVMVRRESHVDYWDREK